MSSSDYEQNVFVNCPFDSDYAALFDAIIFAVHDCGFKARCTLEVDDSAQVRIDKIFDIIEECKFGIHDISRTEIDPTSGLPRFNMPLELGIFLGARRFGQSKQREKICLILDKERYRYQQYCSDISGQDIRSHGGDIRGAIIAVRDWLRNATTEKDVIIPAGSRIFDRYKLFLSELPQLCTSLNLDQEELIYNDYTTLVVGWLRANPW
ncbi:MAG: hypothetical protein OXI59_02140 [Gemmatimonadota bacterium]|nr:hypothetical protein [Gemmatimonadota bacterium]MYB56089.1 hypothetical protein [Gemmatimonadota bacterium]